MQVQRIQSNSYNTSFGLKNDKNAAQKVLATIEPKITENLDRFIERYQTKYYPKHYGWLNKSNDEILKAISELKANIYRWIDSECKYTERKGMKGSIKFLKIRWNDKYGELNPMLIYSVKFAKASKIWKGQVFLMNFAPKDDIEGITTQVTRKRVNHKRK